MYNAQIPLIVIVKFYFVAIRVHDRIQHIRSRVVTVYQLIGPCISIMVQRGSRANSPKRARIGFSGSPLKNIALPVACSDNNLMRIHLHTVEGACLRLPAVTGTGEGNDAFTVIPVQSAGLRQHLIVYHHSVVMIMVPSCPQGPRIFAGRTIKPRKIKAKSVAAGQFQVRCAEFKTAAGQIYFPRRAAPRFLVKSILCFMLRTHSIKHAGFSGT
ncbi:MAG: hypothetical protein BWY09_02138 [Candidatus Hydrogenedentes bacterium ADurb.Bin179]|nr:MAG: hypothetical protein BWY09_02138 [Candidatus Hydrogenedentes bacterium ADurb.Bin179]